MSRKIIVVTGASSGFGRMTAEALAKAGHTVYASMRDVAGRNAKAAAELVQASKRDGVVVRRTRPGRLNMRRVPTRTSRRMFRRPLQPSFQMTPILQALPRSSSKR